jgi:hypothetical protein
VSRSISPTRTALGNAARMRIRTACYANICPRAPTCRSTPRTNSTPSPCRSIRAQEPGWIMNLHSSFILSTSRCYNIRPTLLINPVLCLVSETAVKRVYDQMGLDKTCVTPPSIRWSCSTSLIPHARCARVTSIKTNPIYKSRLSSDRQGGRRARYTSTFTASVSLTSLSRLLAGRARHRFQGAALRQHTILEVSPQRDHQPSGHGDDRNAFASLACTGAIGSGAFQVPAGNFAPGLVTYSHPCHFNQ